MTILIAGGTGFIGKALVKHLTEKGYKLHILSRKEIKSPSPEYIQYFTWDIRDGYIDPRAFHNVTSIINLVGENIGEKRWNKQRRTEILHSRIQPLNLLYEYVSENNLRISTFISSSATGYYGAVTTPEIFTETAPNANDFLGRVCMEWEKAALQFESLGIRTIILRKGVVMSSDGGMIKRLNPMARLGINTAVGSGKQYIPWIGLSDLLRLYEFLLLNPHTSGTYNAVDSQHINMNELSSSLLRFHKKRSILPNVPAFIIKLIFGSMSQMLLQGSRVSNQKLLDTGFTFEQNTIESSF